MFCGKVGVGDDGNPMTGVVGVGGICPYDAWTNNVTKKIVNPILFISYICKVRRCRDFI